MKKVCKTSKQFQKTQSISIHSVKNSKQFTELPKNKEVRKRRLRATLSLQKTVFTKFEALPTKVCGKLVEKTRRMQLVEIKVRKTGRKLTRPTLIEC